MTHFSVKCSHRAVRVRLEVARDPDFHRVVARGDILTTPAVGHSVKARVTGFEAAPALLVPVRDARPAQPRGTLPA